MVRHAFRHFDFKGLKHLFSVKSTENVKKYLLFTVITNGGAEDRDVYSDNS